MGTFTAVLVVPNELDQEYVQQQLERIGVVAFYGPGSLISEDVLGDEEITAAERETLGPDGVLATPAEADPDWIDRMALEVTEGEPRYQLYVNDRKWEAEPFVTVAEGLRFMLGLTGKTERPDDETACANCGVPMFVPTSQAQGEVRCADCSPSEFGAEVSVPRDGGVVQLEFGGFRVGVRLEMTGDGPLLSLKAINCGLEGEMPGEYYLTGRGDGV